MSSITREDLPLEIQEILGISVEEGSCVADQPVCSPDHRVTAQLTTKAPETIILPWRIANAKKGHLILVPGGSAGMIGGLLSQIDPAQYFSHMAIMTKDKVELRHATASSERLQKFPHRAGTEGDAGISLSFVPPLGDTPTDGFQEAPLRYGWPGTITQTVEKAYLTWLNRPTVKDANGVDVPDPRFGELDSQSGERFLIDAVTFGPIHMTVRGRKIIVPLIVVQPCPDLETDAVRAALSRVANAALELRGHYRFYAYTDAQVGLAHDRFGTRVLEEIMDDPESLCTGRKRQVDVVKTAPMVCSTFIWLAVQRANAKGFPKILLDGRPDLPQSPDPQDICGSYFQRETLLDKIDSQTPDGLYFYGKDERLIAAQWLYDHMHQQVIEVLSESTNLKKGLDSLFAGSSALWDISSIVKVLVTFSAPAAALILGITSEALDELVKLLTDLPADVANQICNSFASDWCDYTAKDSDLWKTNTGVGYTVSPDNIVNSWAAPTQENGEVIQGLYGYNWKAIIRAPEVMQDPPPPSVWEISQGFGSMEGRVTFQGVGIKAAEIRVGCIKFRTGSDGGFFRENLPSGRYWAIAEYVHPKSGLLLESKGHVVEIPPGGGIGQVFQLHEPSDTRREVWFDGHMDLVNRYAIGSDWWDHPDIDMKPAYLGLDYFPDEPAFADQRAASMKQTRGDSHQVDDWGQAQISCDLEIQPDKSILVKFKARLRQIESDIWHQGFDVLVPPKANRDQPGFTIIRDLARSEMAWPVRAHIELVIHNDRAE